MSTVMADEPTWTLDHPRKHRISVADYHRMAEVGLLAPDARVELIDGEIIDMAPIGNLHLSTVMHLDDLLHEAVGRRGSVLCQSSIRLGNDSEPQPDLALLKPRADYYRDSHPTAADTLLVIEVSDSTWRYDRTVKVPFYARQGIPEVWVFNLPRSTVHFFRGLAGGRYADESETESPGIVALPGLADASIDLGGILRRP